LKVFHFRKACPTIQWWYKRKCHQWDTCG